MGRLRVHWCVCETHSLHIHAMRAVAYLNLLNLVAGVRDAYKARNDADDVGVTAAQNNDLFSFIL